MAETSAFIRKQNQTQSLLPRSHNLCKREIHTIAECNKSHEVNTKSHGNTDSPLTSSSIPLEKGSGKVTEESDIESQLWKDGEESTRKRRENGAAERHEIAWRGRE